MILIKYESKMGENMIVIDMPKQSEIHELATFISNLNQQSQHHVGFCGTEEDEIAHSMEDEFTDVPVKDAFFIARESDEIVGLLGFDIDLDKGSAEVWGPFIQHSDWSKIADQLWRVSMETLPGTIHTFQSFYNIKNQNGLSFADRLDFTKTSEETILTFNRESLHTLSHDTLQEVSKEHESEMKALHDSLFPNAYYSGNEILHRVNEYKRVFILEDQTGMLGYVYVEVEPQFGEGSIEFVGVKETVRGRGLGSRLISIGLRWLFSFPSVEEIVLCVNSKNDKAIHLYKKAGFQRVHLLTAYKWKRGASTHRD
jgi:ribosomal protein S18 acetylase RimI-like enzyme